ncbi:MAG: PD-(D/E)XK nuclease family protein [Prevotella sp.]|nr:PD-(D/E)XK nuclease family protein [Prevotella sp.]
MNFLTSVAQDILSKHGNDLHNVTIVFPNKRASLFFNRILAELCDRPIWSPRYTTISELFRSMSTLEVADHIKLIFELHKSYCKVTGRKESLDQFYGWGEIMLSDFDDIDKHLGNARQIFTLLSNIHELDAVDYLTPEKIAVLQNFFRNFTAEHNTLLKQRFLELWNKFYDIYTDYRSSLRAQGIAYEGMMYREAINGNGLREAPEHQLERKNGNGNPTVFVGFNLLTPVEKLLITKTGGTIYNDDDNSCPPKQLSIISSPTDDLQARYISQWLTPERIKAGRKTAIVLADESLLETVLHCLPSDINLNITTGYPLASASVTSLIKAVINLLQKGHYTLHNINTILRHPLTRHISEKSVELHAALNTNPIYYLTPEDVSIDDNLRRLFAPLNDKTDIIELIDRLIWVTKSIASPSESTEPLAPLPSEAIYRMYTILNRLKGLVQEDGVNPQLFTSLLNQIIQTTTIPFHGEPLEGIQIMGVLETRNLDFDHVLLLSCNEGNLPSRLSDSSLLPHSIRMAHGLTTIENKVAIYHYYFDRLLQRADDVSILYNNSTSDGKTGEMSRFLLSLIANNEIPIRRHSLESSVATKTSHVTAVDKTPAMIKKLLDKKYLSPSALGKYLRCPMSFYYTYIEDIRDSDNSDEEEMDTRRFGTIFHTAAEMLYSDFADGLIVPHDYIQSLLNEKGHPTIRRIVERAFRKDLFNLENSQRPTPKLGGLQVINFEMVVTFLIKLLRYDLTLTRLQICGLEKEVRGTIPVTTADGNTIDVRIGGSIDRLDAVTDIEGKRRLRVIDYKTGRLTRRLNLSGIDDIFLPEKIGAHTDYFLQALLYAMIVSEESPSSPVSCALLYVQHVGDDNYSPLLSINNEEITDAHDYLPEFRKGLSQLIGDIINTNIPFTQTPDTARCQNCALHDFCH